MRSLFEQTTSGAANMDSLLLTLRQEMDQKYEMMRTEEQRERVEMTKDQLSEAHAGETDDLRSQVHKLSSNTEGFRREMESLRDQLADSQGQLAENRNHRSNAEAQVRKLSTRTEALTREVESLRDDVAEHQSQLAKNKHELAKNKYELAKNEDQHAQHHDEIKSLRDELSVTRQELGDVRENSADLAQWTACGVRQLLLFALTLPCSGCRFTVCSYLGSNCSGPHQDSRSFRHVASPARGDSQIIRANLLRMARTARLGRFRH